MSRPKSKAVFDKPSVQLPNDPEPYDAHGGVAAVEEEAIDHTVMHLLDANEQMQRMINQWLGIVRQLSDACENLARQNEELRKKVKK